MDDFPLKCNSLQVGDEGGNGIAADDLVEDEFCSSPDPSPNKQKTR